jgi:putative acetyltransferase
MSIAIRDERPEDIDAIREVNRLAFGQEHEGRLVDALRARGAVTLSLVAVADGAVVGHILFSPLTAGSEAGAGLGPMAVAPAYQRSGIGSQLVTHGIERLRQAGCPFIVVLGHPEFYPRFGFRPAAALGLTCEWNVPDEVFMVKVLTPQAADRLSGRVEYQAEFSALGA